MILIVTGPTDPHADDVARRLAARGAAVVRFDPADFPRAATLELRYQGRAGRSTLVVGGRRLELAELRAAWFRRPGRPVAHAELGDGWERRYAAEECAQLVADVWSALDVPWLPGPLHLMRRAESKPIQLRAAQALGLVIPDTLITNDARAFLDFYRAHDGALIDKQPSVWLARHMANDVVRYTEAITTRDVGYAQRLRYSPMLLQTRVEKRLELRVTVVGERVFTAEIHSQATRRTQVDWRRYDHGRTPHAVHALPPAIEAACVALVERFGLRFGTLDFIVTPDGEYVFLELNPNGQWLWIEKETGLPISQAVCDLLLQAQ